MGLALSRSSSQSLSLLQTRYAGRSGCENSAGVSKMSFASVLIFTLNEELHLPACLDTLEWSDDVTVVDSYSTDRTEEICRERGINFVQHNFEGFGRQRQWALDTLSIKHDWVLILDADERVPEELACEIGEILSHPPSTVGAFRVRRRFHLWGRWLRYSSLYPTWVVRLVHKRQVCYVDRGHAETQMVNGEILELHNDLIDENLKGIDEWFARQNRYSRRDAEYELAQESKTWTFRELVVFDPSVRRAALKRLAWRVPGRGFIYFVYSYFWRRGFLDGRDGFVLCLMRSLYQSMVAIKKYDLRRRAELREHLLPHFDAD
jgi:glycosyltransferase involved in cell wall biosynthesis